MMKSKIALSLWLAAALAAPVARAQVASPADPRARAKEHYRSGQEHYAKGEYQGALTDFALAYKSHPGSVVLLAIGKTEAKLGEPRKAAVAMAKFVLAAGPRLSPSERGALLAEIDRLRSLDRQSGARALLDRGIALRDDLKWSEAADAFEASYAITPSAQALSELGRAAAKAGENARALDAYWRLIPMFGTDLDPIRRDEVKAEMKRLYRLVGLIEVECPLKGAKVFLDGEPRATTPTSQPLFVEPGRHAVRVEKDENVLLETELELAAGDTRTVQVSLDFDEMAK